MYQTMTSYTFNQHNVRSQFKKKKKIVWEKILIVSHSPESILKICFSQSQIW